jgi:hypothetical protein
MDNDQQPPPPRSVLTGCLIAVATPFAVLAGLAGGCLISEGGLNFGREAFITDAALEIMLISGVIAAFFFMVAFIVKQLPLN